MFLSQVIALLRHFGPMDVQVMIRNAKLDARD